MSNEDNYTVATIKRERLYGLKLRAMHVKPRTSTGAYLDHILEKAGIPLVSEQEFKEKNKEVIAK